MKAQLPQEISYSDLNWYFDNDAWYMAQKLDGHRLIVQTAPLAAFNRKGEPREVPAGLEALAAYPRRFVFDGEYVGATFHIFDILETTQGDIRGWKWGQRQAFLRRLAEALPELNVVTQHYGGLNKRNFLSKCRHERAEGVVFSHAAHSYKEGNSHYVVKYKFIKQVDCAVVGAGIDGKHNYELAVYRDGAQVTVGKVSALTGDGEAIQIGDVVTVNVLYVGQNNKLVQATKPRVRDDKAPHECLFDQLDLIRTNKAVLEWDDDSVS